MKLLVFTSATVLLIAGAASAARQRAACASCNARQRVVVQQKAVVQQQVVKQVVQQVVKKEVVAAVVPVAQFVQVPLYTAVFQGVAGYGAAGYSAQAGSAGAVVPPGGAAAQDAPVTLKQSDVKAIAEALKALDARLGVIEQRMGARPPAPGPQKEKEKDGDVSTRMLRLVTARCAGCHDATVSEEKGNGFTLRAAGRLAVLTDKQARKLVTMTYAGKMPPKEAKVAALTDEEVATVIEFVDSLK